MSGSNEKQPKKKLALVREDVKKLGVRSGIQTGTAYIRISPIGNSAVGGIRSLGSIGPGSVPPQMSV